MNYKTVMKICWRCFSDWINNPRIVLAFTVGIMASCIDVYKMFDYASLSKEPLQMFEPFIYNASTNYIVTLWLLGVILLFADAPFAEQSTTYILVRTNRKIWLLGKILYVLISIFLYCFCVLLSTVVLYITGMYVGNVWSSPFYEIVMKDAAVPLYRFGFEAKEMIYIMLPLKAFVMSFALICLYFFLASLLLFLINIKCNKVIGFAFVSSLHCFGYMFSYYDFSRFFPFSHAMLGSVIISQRTDTYHFCWPFIYYLAIITIVIIWLFKSIKNVDLRITQGTRK